MIGKIHSLDCLEGLARLGPESVDFVFADLPYGRTQSTWDKLIPTQHLWPALHRVCKPTAAMVFTAMQPFTSLLVCSNLDDFRYEMIWKKNKTTGFLNAKRQPLRSHESALVFYRQQPTYVPQMTESFVGHAAYGKRSPTSVYGAMPPERIPWGGSTKRHPTSVLEIPIVNNDSPERIHVNQKPEGLPAWFIKTYTRLGDIVLDPAAGSGTTLVAAARLGRRYIGFENDSAMAERANERLADLTRKAG